MEPTAEQIIKTRLEKGLVALGIELQHQQQQKLLAYLALLEKWNKAYNLSAVRDREEMVGRHLLDSLAVLPVLQHEKMVTLADIGSGAGLPGIPLAIARPEWQITLVDSNGKKTGFLRQAKTQLQLEGLTIINDRIENLREPFDAVISRAFASLKDTVILAGGLMDQKTVLWAMKGRLDPEELSGLPKPYKVSASHALTVPDCEGERHLLKIVHE